MKKVFKTLILSIFIFTGLFISANAASVPEEIKELGSKYYIQTHAFDCDNDFALYFDKTKLVGKFDFDITKFFQLSVRNNSTLDWVYANGNISEENSVAVVDFSALPMGEYTIRVAFNTSGNVYTDGYQIVDFTALKSSSYECIFITSSSVKDFERHLDVYGCVSAQDYWYYTDYLAPKEGSDQYTIFKPLADSLTKNLTTDYDKARAIYTWIADNIYYDYPACFTGSSSDKQAASDPVTVFNTKRAICGGYSRVMDIMLTLSGIPSLYVSGVAYPSGIAHAWNVVCLDGTWCYMDVTWGSGNKYDNNTFTKGSVNYQYFAVTASFISQTRTINRGFSNLCLNNMEYAVYYYPALGTYEAVATDYFSTPFDTVYIRDYIAGIPVTALDEDCFHYTDPIKNIYLPETIKYVANAFEGIDNLNLYVTGKNTQLATAYYDCDNLTVYMPFSSQYFKGEDGYSFTVVNTDFEVNGISIDGNTLTATIHNGLLKTQPKLVLAIYDNNNTLHKAMVKDTFEGIDTYSFDITGFNSSYSVKAFLISDANSLIPYNTAFEQRLSQTINTGITLESFHKYLPDDDETRIYAYDGICHSIDVTFNEQTFTAENDYIYIYDMNDNLIGTYTGDELSGKTINILGNTVKIRLVTDSKGNAYGYKTTSIIVAK
ncbi:MAG: hypothetical protein IKU60_01230 [Clostridia bacterium]|nr:hypothetical protein [Clostridia bacterium]